jgi:hypothetical protein
LRPRPSPRTRRPRRPRHRRMGAIAARRGTVRRLRAPSSSGTRTGRACPICGRRVSRPFRAAAIRSVSSPISANQSAAHRARARWPWRTRIWRRATQAARAVVGDAWTGLTMSGAAAAALRSGYQSLLNEGDLHIQRLDICLGRRGGTRARHVPAGARSLPRAGRGANGPARRVPGVDDLIDAVPDSLPTIRASPSSVSSGASARGSGTRPES